MIHKRSVTVQRHRQSGNLKCDGPTDGLIEVGARDADESKKDNERNLSLIKKKQIKIVSNFSAKIWFGHQLSPKI